MVRWPLVLIGVSLALVGTPAHAGRLTEDRRPGPYAVGLEGGVGIGLFFATHGKVALSVGRRFWDHLDLEADFRVDAGKDLVGLEARGRVGLLLRLADAWEVLLGWRVGYAWFRLHLPGRILWTEAIATSVVVEARYPLTSSLELRLSPVAVTGYWNEIWGFVLEPGAAIAYRF